jgi:hypothetical protein
MLLPPNEGSANAQPAFNNPFFSFKGAGLGQKCSTTSEVSRDTFFNDFHSKTLSINSRAISTGASTRGCHYDPIQLERLQSTFFTLQTASCFH